jgi:hypothetical protein
VIFQNEPIFSWFSGGEVFNRQKSSATQVMRFEKADEDGGEFAD